MFTNRNSHSDFVLWALERFSTDCERVMIAVPFFTDAAAVDRLVDRGSEVLLIVRLGFPTSETALKKAIENDRVHVRFYTSQSFHPKLYVFGDEIALVGSANLTDRALKTNQEIMVSIPSDDHRFDDLVALFDEYWMHASVLTNEQLAKYAYLLKRHDQATTGAYELERDVKKSIGNIEFPNITRDQVKKSAADTFLENYRKTYQETVAAFREVRDVYESVGKRRVGENVIPLRLEIDSFLSFVRVKHAQGELWRDTSLSISRDERKDMILPLLDEWLTEGSNWFDNHVVPVNYPRLLRIFESPESLKSASNDDLFDALCTLHSFFDRRRFYAGGLEGLKTSFFAANTRERIDGSLTYLVFGQDETIRRMCSLIFAASQRLACFGRANVQELVGWMNQQELPVINGRTTKVLRYFGLKVRQCA